MADLADVGVDVAEGVELVFVGVGELAPEVVMVGALGEGDNVRLGAEAGDAEEGFVFVPGPRERGGGCGVGDVAVDVSADGDIDQ